MRSIRNKARRCSLLTTLLGCTALGACLHDDEDDAGPACGNAVIEAGEQCDDGNVTTGDGCSAMCLIEPPPEPEVPSSQFNIGDSIGEGRAANGTLGQERRHTVWSTGYSLTDSVDTMNERYERLDAEGYFENNEQRDVFINQSQTGDRMAEFAVQAQRVIDAAAQVPDGRAGQVTVLLGANDVCADSNAEMTDVTLFETQYRAGLDKLASSAATMDAQVHVSSIPAVYWLWESKRGSLYCRTLAWPFVPCENLLEKAGNDCVDSDSTIDPDNIHQGDGPNCFRRKTLHARIRDEYNPVLERVLDEYRNDGRLPNARYVDVFDVRFFDEHINDGDCFHPSREGHDLLAREQFCRTELGRRQAECGAGEP